MRIKAIKKLVDINILYAIQPSQLQQYRKMQAKNPERKVNVSLKAIRMYLILGLVYLFLFGLMGSLNQLVGNPGLFANLVSAFALFSMSQGFLVFYNVFYESKDLQSYRPYAFSEAEIIVGKSISVILTLLIAILPMFSYFLVLAFQGGNPFLGLPLALLAILILSSVITFLILIAVHFITKTAFFRKYKTILSNVILALVSVGSFFLYFMINQMNSRSVVNRTEVKAFFPPVQAFYDFILHPFHAASLLGFLGWVAVAALLFFIVKTKVIPEFYEAALMTGSSVGKRERVHDINIAEVKNLKKFVWRYNIRLLSEGSVIMQAIFMSAFLPYIVIFSMGMGMIQGGLSLTSYLGPRFLLPMIALAVLIATLNSGGSNLTAIGISLERENFDYLKVLPFDLKQYIRLKFWQLFAVQSILPLTLLLITSLVSGMHPVTFLGMVIVWALISLMWSSWGYYRDYKHLVTNWSNVTELMSRDNNMVKTLLAIALILGMLIVITLLFFISNVLAPLVIYIIAALVLVGLAVLSYIVHKYYMKKLNEELAVFY